MTSFLDGFISSFNPDVSQPKVKISGMMLELMAPPPTPPPSRAPSPDSTGGSAPSGSCFTVSDFTVSNKSSKKEDVDDDDGAPAPRSMKLSSYPVLVLLIDALVKQLSATVNMTGPSS